MRLVQLQILVIFLNSSWAATDTVRTYLGCFETSKTSTLQPHLISSNMTISICSKLCSSINLPVFGLEHGRYCYCVTHERVFETYGVAPDYECNIPCAGAQLCGGNNFIVFYKSDVFQGCFAFPSQHLNLFGGYIPNLTLDVCQMKCGDSYSGLTQGNKCYCSDELPRIATYVNASDCSRNSLYCRGGEKCGGSGNIAIWMNEETRSKSDDLYLGCYEKNFLIGPKWINEKMKTFRCSSFCASNNYTMYALQSGIECSCGTYDDKYEYVGTFESRCNTPCSGEECGHDVAMKVYRGTDYEGCFIHAANSPLLFQGNMTERSICSKNCQGYLYFGVNREGCYCGNELPEEELTGFDSSCSSIMTCTAHQKCGGRGFFAVWTNLHIFQMEHTKFHGCFPAPLPFDFKGPDKSLEDCTRICQCSHLYVAMTTSHCFCGDNLPQNDTEVLKTLQLLYSDYYKRYYSNVCNSFGSGFQAVWEILSIDGECNTSGNTSYNQTTIQDTGRNRISTWLFFVIVACIVTACASVLKLTSSCRWLKTSKRSSLQFADMEGSGQEKTHSEDPDLRLYISPNNGLYAERLYSEAEISPVIRSNDESKHDVLPKKEFSGAECTFVDENLYSVTDSDNTVMYFLPTSW